MKKLLICLLMLSFLLVTATAQARKSAGLDMADYTCGDLMNENEEDIGVILLWVDGYISCKTQDLRLDLNWIEELANSIVHACRNRPNRYLMDIVEDIAER